MAWRRVTKYVRELAPLSVQTAWLELLAKRYGRGLCRASGLVDKVAFATGKHVHRSNQRPEEILSLLTRLTDLQPRIICEIGSAGGGTLSLFAQCATRDALLISIDPVHETGTTRGFRHLVAKNQRLEPIAADSHDEKTLTQVQQLLQGRKLDFLFIDGDHTFSGVSQDLEMYGPLVRDGGLVAFHDIVDDRRDGTATVGEMAYAGGVPDFFQRCVQPSFRTDRFVQDPNQRGYGIGVIEWPDSADAELALAQVCRLAEEREEVRQVA